MVDPENKDVVEETTSTEEESSTSTENTTESSEVDSKDDSTEELPYHKNPRWQEIIKQRDDAKRLADDLQKQVADLKKTSDKDIEVTPQLQVLIDRIIEKVESRSLERAEKQREEEEQMQKRIKEETDKLISKIKKEVGSEEAFNNSFKPFFQKKAKIYGDIDPMGVLEEWKEVYADKGDRVSSPSGGSDKKISFEAKPNESFQSIAARAARELEE